MVKSIFTLTAALLATIFSWAQTRTSYELLLEKQGASVQIEWRTLEGFNIEYYEVYKLNENDGWEVMETVQHDEHVLSWSVTDSSPNEGTNSYLLRALEITGLPHFSGIETIFFEAPSFEVLVYPNPASDWIVINSEESNETFEAELVNRHGISVVAASSNRGSILLDTSHVVEGIYYVKINNSRMKYSKPVVINHR